MKPREMRDMTLEELQVQHDQLMDELVTLRIKLNMRQLDNPKRVHALKRDVARAKTIIREKQAGAQPGAVPGSGA